MPPHSSNHHHSPPLSYSSLDCCRLELNFWTPQVRHIPHNPDLRRLRLSQIPLLLLRIPTINSFHSHLNIVRLPTPFSIKLPHSLVSRPGRLLQHHLHTTQYLLARP